MKLVTYEKDGKRRAGALVEGDRKIVDLAFAHADSFGEDYAAFGTVLSMIEAGDAALDRAYETLKKADSKSAIDRSSVKLLAPVPIPPQIRDCLCFELHLKQSFNAVRRIR